MNTKTKYTKKHNNKDKEEKVRELKPARSIKKGNKTSSNTNTRSRAKTVHGNGQRHTRETVSMVDLNFNPNQNRTPPSLVTNRGWSPTYANHGRARHNSGGPMPSGSPKFFNNRISDHYMYGVDGKKRMSGTLTGDSSLNNSMQFTPSQRMAVANQSLPGSPRWWNSNRPSSPYDFSGRVSSDAYSPYDMDIFDEKMQMTDDPSSGRRNTFGHGSGGKQKCITMFDGNANNILDGLVDDIPLSPGSSYDSIDKKRKKKKSSISLAALAHYFQYHTS